MRSLLQFRAPLVFGLLLNFCSGFGQTFFVSLFVPSLRETYSLTEGDFGLYYSLLTLTSALMLPKASAILEKLSWRLSGSVILLALALSAFSLSISTSIFMAVLSIFGLRLFGQGLSSHMSSVAIVKSVPMYKATALSLASLGYPLSEAFLPFVAFFTLSTYGWQASWGYFTIAALGLVPFFFLLGREIEKLPKALDKNSKPDTHIPALQIIKDPIFLKYLPASLCAPFYATGIFLYQTSISELKGWNPQTLSFGFAAFAITRLVFSLVGGPIIDKHGARKIFPIFLIPMMLGIFVLAFATAPWAAWAFMILMGISIGSSTSLKSALWSELYGAELHGRYRSMSASFMVFSTSISPLLFGFLFEKGISLQLILTVSAFSIALSSWIARPAGIKTNEA